VAAAASASTSSRGASAKSAAAEKRQHISKISTFCDLLWAHYLHFWTRAPPPLVLALLPFRVSWIKNRGCINFHSYIWNKLPDNWFYTWISNFGQSQFLCKKFRIHDTFHVPKIAMIKTLY